MESIHDLAYREAAMDVNKIIEHPDFKREFRLTFGREEHTALRKWLANTVNAASTEASASQLQKIMSHGRTGMVMNAIGFRVMTVLKHGTSAGIKTIAYFVGAEKYMFAAARQVAMKPFASTAWAIENIPEIAARAMQQDRDYKSLHASMFEPESFQGKAHRFGHSAVAFFDFMTAVPTAIAAYNRAITDGISKNRGGTGKPMSHEDAAKYASKIVREAHGTQIETARSLIMNERSEAVKMLTTLYGFMNNTYGQQRNMVNQLKTPGFSTVEALARGFGALIVPAFVTHMLTHGFGEDDESLFHWLAMAVGTEVAGTVPGLRDAWSMAQGFRGAGVVGVESALTSLVKPFIDIGRVFAGKENNTLFRDMMDAVGIWAHLPLGQIGASGQYLINIGDGTESPEGVWDFTKGLVKGHGDKNH